MLYYREKTKSKTYPLLVGKSIALLGVTVLSIFLFSGSSVRTNMDATATMRQSPKGLSPLPETTPVPTEDPTLAHGFFTEPAVGVLTSDFGARWGREHTGIDIGADHGADILAADGGVVLLSGWVDGYGNYIILDHENGFQTGYAHCNELLVTDGERVSQGQKIAYVGNTGNSTGPHLHFEVKLDGVFQNPLNYVMY